jgi:hypothetical protein
MKILAIVVILLTSFLDPIAQVLLQGRYAGTVDWWTFHLVKWGAFYPPLVYIVLREFWIRKWIIKDADFKCFGNKVSIFKAKPDWINILLWIPLITAASWLTWQAGMWVSGAGWESWIVRLLKGWL